MLVKQSLYDNVVKARQQKKGVVTFLERQGYSTRFAEQVRNSLKANTLQVR